MEITEFIKKLDSKSSLILIGLLTEHCLEIQGTKKQSTLATKAKNIITI